MYAQWSALPLECPVSHIPLPYVSDQVDADLPFKYSYLTAVHKDELEPS